MNSEFNLYADRWKKKKHIFNGNVEMNFQGKKKKKKNLRTH